MQSPGSRCGLGKLQITVQLRPATVSWKGQAFSTPQLQGHAQLGLGHSESTATELYAVSDAELARLALPTPADQACLPCSRTRGLQVGRLQDGWRLLACTC